MQELALHGLLDIERLFSDGKLPLQWRFSQMWTVNLKKERKTYQKFVLGVIRKYPKHQIHLHIGHDGHRDLQRSVQRRLSEGLKLFTRRRGGGLVFRTSVQLRHLKDLCLYQCTELLREVDLRNLPNLRSFTMQECGRVIVTGWKYVTKLEWLMLRDCLPPGSPEMKHLSSLKYLYLQGMERGSVHCNWLESSEGCQLQSLTISKGFIYIGIYKHLANLEKLQSLSFFAVDVPSWVVQSISVLHSLTELSFIWCKFFWDDDLEYRTDLSALRHLSSLVLSHTRNFWYKGTRGVEKLESLTYLNCEYSDLEHLPDLSHMNKLRWVYLNCTPFLKKVGSGDLPEWLSKLWEETVFTATEWKGSAASDYFSESENESGSDSES